LFCRAVNRSEPGAPSTYAKRRHIVGGSWGRSGATSGELGVPGVGVPARRFRLDVTSSAATSACASAIRLLSDGFAWPRQNACYCRAAKCGRRERNNSAQSGSHWTRVRACNKSNPLRFLTSINPIRFAGWQHALRSAFSFSVETATRRRVSNEAAVDPRAGRRAGDRRSIGRKARHRSDPRSRSVSARRHARFARCRTIRTKATRRDESKRVLCLSEIKLARTYDGVRQEMA
jgi:hypothetical protein